MRRPHVLAVLLGLEIAMVVAGPGLWHRARVWHSFAHPSAPTVVFVVLDDTRADHTSLCGYSRPTTPVLASLALDRGGIAAGASYTCDAVAPGNWSLPSHAAYFTGRSSPEIGARLAAPGSRAFAEPLSPDVLTLADRFVARGYQTALVSGNNLIAPETGLTRGFEHHHSSTYPYESLVGGRLLDAVDGMLDTEIDPSRPLFLFVNIFDAHQPWDTVPAGLGWVPARPALDLFASPGSAASWHHFVTSATPAERRQLVSRVVDGYDYGIYEADHDLGEVLDAIAGHGWLGAGSRVVVASDHGEHLGEHDLLSHGGNLAEDTQRVWALARGVNVDFPQPFAAKYLYNLVLDGTLPATMDDPVAFAFPYAYWSRDTSGKIGADTMVAAWHGTEKEVWTHGDVVRYDLAADPREDHPIPEPFPWPALSVDVARAVQPSSTGGVDPGLLGFEALGYIAQASPRRGDR